MRPGNSLTWVLRAVGVVAVLGSLGSIVGCGEADDSRPAKWSYIYPAIIEPSCATASCHSRFATRSGVDLSNINEAYFQFKERHFVTPGRSAESAVINLMLAQGSRRMPPDFALPNVDIALIAKWIDVNLASEE